MKKFFMKFFMKFLYFFSFVFSGFSSIVFYDLKNWFFLFFSGGMTLLFFCAVVLEEKEPEETPKEKTKTENLKTDNPEDNEIITVTEIKGERNIIIDVVVKIIVFIIGLVLTGFLTSFLRYLGLSGVIITILGLLPLILAIKYCFTTNDKDKDKE